MKKNNYWFSLPLAMGIVVLMSLLAYTMLEYVIPYSRDVKWVENSSKAYYQASSAVEDWQYYLNVERTDETSDNSTLFTWEISNKYVTTSVWNTIPPAWEWNSQYDNNWNTISQWNPIQLSVWNDYLDLASDNFNLNLRIPDIDGDTYYNDITLSWSSFTPYTPIINWQLSSFNNTLYASWSKITNYDINPLFNEALDNKNWSDISWNILSFETFYNNNCWSGSWCIFKVSVVNPILDSSNWSSIPYLEWKLETGNDIPIRYIKLESSWRSYWFKKDLEVKIPTETVNEAFDFTVFQ